MSCETKTGLFHSALAAHQAGDTKRAIDLYGQAIAANDLAPDALNNLAALASSEKRFSDADGFLERALALVPHSAELHANRARVALALGDGARALQHLDDASARDAGFSSLYFEFGTALIKAGQYEVAGGFLARAIALQPTHFDAHLDLGVVHFFAKRLDLARVQFERALQLNPELAAVRENIAAVCVEKARAERAAANIAAAETAYRDALSASPGCFEAKVELAYMLVEHGHPRQGFALYESASRDRPYRADLLVNLGHACNELRRFEDAIGYFGRALEIDATLSEARINLGVALHGLARFDEALAQFDAALALFPGSASAQTSKGNTLQSLGRLDAAIECHMRALASDPDDAQAHLNLGVAHLLAGDYVRGWPHYAWRWRVAKHRAKIGVGDFTPRRPEKHSDVAGKNILVTCEQGFGDSIHFVRYVDALVRLGARVTLLAQPELAKLFEQLRGLDRVATEIDRNVPFDYSASVLDLAAMFWNGFDDIPGRTGYLRAAQADMDRWSAILGAKTSPRVGLVWSGSADHAEDANRSLPLEDFSRLLVPGIDYIALQKDIRPADRRILAQTPEIRVFGDLLGDFCDTAALCQLVDLVVTVDTSVAHLAGALGRPALIALPLVPDWRWSMSGSKTHWYESARLVRQSRRGSWEDVFQAIAAELGELRS